MADQIFEVQIKLSGGVKSPIYTGDKRLTLIALARLLNGRNHGATYKNNTGYVQVQSSLVAASATATCAAVVNADHVDIGGTAITAAQRRATATVTPGTAGNVPVADDTVTLNGVVFTAVDGAVVLGEPTFDISGTDAQMCASLAAQVNGYASPLLSGLIAAKASSTVVTFYAITQGTAGNAFTLNTNDNTRLAKSGATFANGAAIANNTFDFAGTDATTGDALAAAINASTTAAVKQVTAVSDGAGVVTVAAKSAGLGGNTITFTSNDGTRLAVTGSGFLASGSEGAVTRWTF